MYFPSFNEILSVAYSRGAASEAPGLWKGLVGAWPLQEGGGTAAFDVSGFSKNGTLTNMEPATDWQASPVGYCLEFDGSNESVLADAVTPIGTGSFSVSAWVNLDVGVSNASAAIVSQGDLGSDEWMFRVSAADSANAKLQLYGAAGQINPTQTTGEFVQYKGSWVHVVAVRDAPSTDAIIYINGVEVGRDDVASYNLSTTKQIQIGCADSTAGRWWEGKITNVAFWHRTILPGEIVELYVDPWAMYRQRRRTSFRGVTIIEGTVCWGHDTAVEEDNTRDFTGDWTGTGSISGAGDAEQIDLDDGETMETSPVVHTGAVTVTIQKNKYGSGDAEVVVNYRHGATVAACQAAAWNEYAAPFVSAGYVQVQVENEVA